MIKMKTRLPFTSRYWFDYGDHVLVEKNEEYVQIRLQDKERDTAVIFDMSIAEYETFKSALI